MGIFAVVLLLTDVYQYRIIIASGYFSEKAPIKLPLLPITQE